MRVGQYTAGTKGDTHSDLVLEALDRPLTGIIGKTILAMAGSTKPTSTALIEV